MRGRALRHLRARLYRGAPVSVGSRHEKRRGEGLLLGGLCGILLAACAIHWMNAQLRPIMAELAEAQVRNEITLVVNDVVAQKLAAGHISYDSIVQLETDASGAVTALKSDMSAVNLLRGEILSALVETVGRVDTRNMGIPLGNLTGVNLLSGRGPRVPVRALTTGTATAAFENAFSAAGINQTRHQIILSVSVPVRILLPGTTAATDVSCQVCIAETIIVGAVPETYLQLPSKY